MLFLLISVCLSVAVSVLLKLARRRQLEVTQMVAVNYPVAALLSRELKHNSEPTAQPC